MKQLILNDKIIKKSIAQENKRLLKIKKEYINPIDFYDFLQELNKFDLQYFDTNAIKGYKVFMIDTNTKKSLENYKNLREYMANKYKHKVAFLILKQQYTPEYKGYCIGIANKNKLISLWQENHKKCK